MSRDFAIFCATAQSSAAGARRLQSFRALNSRALFNVAPREQSAFCELIHSREICSPISVLTPAGAGWDMANDVAFVALKSRIHNAVGFLIDLPLPPAPGADRTFPLFELFHILVGALAAPAAAHPTFGARATSPDALAVSHA